MNRWFLAWLAALSSLVIAFFVAPTAHANATGTITGVVSDTGGHPIKGAVAVLLTRASNDNQPVVVTQATTGPTGTFQLSAAAGTYNLCFDGTPGSRTGTVGGYLSTCFGRSSWDDAASDARSNPVAVAGATTTPGFNAKLAPAAGVAGTVTAAAGGAGLANVHVRAYTFDGFNYTISKTATTAADGTFAINGLAPNVPVRICFEAGSASGGTSTTGYESQCYSNQPWQGDDVPGASTVINPLAGQVTASVNAALVAGSRITGRVTDGASNGVAGVAVLVYTIANGELATNLGNAVTDASGNYVVSGLQPSASGYNVCLDSRQAHGGNSTTGYLGECYANLPWDDGNVGTLPSGTAVPVAAGGTSSGIDQALSPAGAISGRVTGNSAGLANVHVTAYGNSSGPVTVNTAADGSYTIPGLYGGDNSYRVCFDPSQSTGGSSPTGYLGQCYNGQYWDTSQGDIPAAATQVSVTAGSTTSGINASLARAGGISGTVTAGGVGVQDVTVLVYSVASGYLATGYSTVSTGADGSYAVKGLKPGASAYRVCFDTAVASGGPSSTGYTDQCYDGTDWDGFTSPTSTKVSVTASTSTPSINASLTTAGAISGHVTSTVGGGGVGNVSVFVVPVANLALSTGYASAITTSDGSYTVKRLPPSSSGYAVCFEASQATGGGSTTGYLDECNANQSWSGSFGDFPPGLTAVPVTTGATATVDAALDSAGAISGRAVESGTNAPLSGVTITLYKDGTEINTGGVTGPDGTYRINGLVASDTYLVCFDPTPSVGGVITGHQKQCYRNQPWDGFDPPPTGLNVAVSAGATTPSINASFKPAAGISGTVTAASGGAPVRGATVTIYDSAKNYVESVSTNNAGAYLAGTLPTSTRGYYICVDASFSQPPDNAAGFVRQCYNGVTQTDSQVPTGATKIPLAAGQNATVDFSLAAASAISGTVTTGTTPLFGANITVFDTHGNPVGNTSTSESGTYLVPGLSPSSTGYLVCADGAFATGGTSTAGYLAACWKTKPWIPGNPPAGTRVPVPASTTVTGIDMKLGAASGISGTVSGFTGNNFFATVDVYDQSGNFMGGTGFGGSDGSWSIGGLPANSQGYVVCFDMSGSGYVNQCYQNVDWDGISVPAGAQPVVTTAGAVTTGIDETAVKAASISGKVTSQATSLAVTKVSVFLADTSGNDLSVANVSATGSYTFSDVMPGGYEVCVQAKATSPGGPYAPECYSAVAWDGNFPIAAATTVTVAAGAKVTGINVALPPAA